MFIMISAAYKINAGDDDNGDNDNEALYYDTYEMSMTATRKMSMHV